MTLEIISSSEVMFTGEVESVTLPGQMGLFTVLRNHASLIAALVKGRVKYRTPDAREEEVEITGGLVDVDNNRISVCIY